jgi:hypothetical protein
MKEMLIRALSNVKTDVRQAQDVFYWLRVDLKHEFHRTRLRSFGPCSAPGARGEPWI